MRPEGAFTIDGTCVRSAGRPAITLFETGLLYRFQLGCFVDSNWALGVLGMSRNRVITERRKLGFEKFFHRWKAEVEKTLVSDILFVIRPLSSEYQLAEVRGVKSDDLKLDQFG